MEDNEAENGASGVVVISNNSEDAESSDGAESAGTTITMSVTLTEQMAAIIAGALAAVIGLLVAGYCICYKKRCRGERVRFR
jgi:hypothetical protein